MGNISRFVYTNNVPDMLESASNALLCLLKIDFDKAPFEGRLNVLSYDSNAGKLKVRVTLYESPNKIMLHKKFLLDINDPFVMYNFRKNILLAVNGADANYIRNVVEKWLDKNGIDDYKICSIFGHGPYTIINFGNEHTLLRLPFGMEEYEYEVLLKAYFCEYFIAVEENNDD